MIKYIIKKTSESVIYARLVRGTQPVGSTLLMPNLN